MAGSRLEKFGTVFTRVRDLMRAGVIKQAEKPIWYDVYKAFPPKRDPLHVKPHNRPSTRKMEAVPEIFYREDQIRAEFYEQFRTSHPFDLTKPNFVSICQRFVNKYTELKSHSELDNSALFKETGKALLKEGVTLSRRTGALKMSPKSKDLVVELMQTDMSTEQQSVSADSQGTTDSTHTHHSA